jgi:two-component system chemotaxis response regulator CheY
MLIIDDSPTMRRYLASIAGELQIDADLATDGLDAMSLMEKNTLSENKPFDVALVDWDMPRMNGLQLVRAVRARPEFSSTKLMMVTSHNALQDIRVAVSAGADDYLMKPLDSAMIAEKLRIMGLLD